MNATVLDFGAAARHRQWQAQEAQRCELARLAAGVEVRALATRAQVNECLGRAWCSAIRKLARRHGVRHAAGYLRAQGIGLGVARLLLLGRL
jgi:hypothetical protein